MSMMGKDKPGSSQDFLIHFDENSSSNVSLEKNVVRQRFRVRILKLFIQITNGNETQKSNR